MIIITFFAAIQYIFYSWVPSTITNFAYIAITSFIGFIILTLIFVNELFRIDKWHILTSLILAIENLFFNIFVLIGSKKVEPTIISCVLSFYFAFVPLIEFIWFKKKPTLNVIISIIVVIFGLLFLMNFNIKSLLSVNILLLFIADLFFALYIVTIGKFSLTSNPSIMAIGQLFFGFIIASLLWVVESFLKKESLAIPTSTAFWGSVIFISFFIRSFYGVIQIYAQRFVSAFDASLIFSSEIILSLMFSHLVANVFGIEIIGEKITILKVIGAIIMILGLLISDINIFNKLFGKKAKNSV